MTPDGAPDRTTRQGGVLAALPRTRPQRASARRAAARRKPESETTAAKKAPRTHARAKAPQGKQPAAGPVTAAPATAPSARTRAKAKTAGKASVKRKPRLAAVKPPEPAVPKQGYEPEEEVELGKPVSPPSGLELVESLVAVAGELAGGSLSAGGRMLKDALSGLRRL